MFKEVELTISHNSEVQTLSCGTVGSPAEIACTRALERPNWFSVFGSVQVSVQARLVGTGQKSFPQSMTLAQKRVDDGVDSVGMYIRLPSSPVVAEDEFEVQVGVTPCSKCLPNPMCGLALDIPFQGAC